MTQEFINHSGVILKAYNFGKQVECEARRSFGDISQRQEEKRRNDSSFENVFIRWGVVLAWVEKDV